MKHNNKLTVFLPAVFIFFFSLIIRIILLDQIPPGLNRDEAAIGYNAYSLLKSGRDEFGRFLPLSFESFGDWKLPLYIYLSIPSIFLFGLNDWSVRLLSVIAGSLTVLITYYLSLKIFQNRQTAFLSSVILMITPWHFFLSRTASEANLAVFFVALAYVLFLYLPKKNFLIIPSFISLALALYTYHGSHIFIPLFILGLLIIYRAELKTVKYLKISLLIFLLLSGIILGQTLLKADKTKISGLFPTSDISAVYNSVVLKRINYQDPNNFFTVAFHNKFLFTVKSIIEGYIKGFSPEFLFIKGGNNWQHNIADFGNLHLWQAPFIIIGLFFLVRTKNRHLLFLFYWLFISSIAPSLTKDAPHTSRMAALLPLPALLTGYGLYVFYSIFKRSVSKAVYPAVMILMFLAICFNTSMYFDEYFYQFPINQAVNWGLGLKQMALKTGRHQEQFTEVLISKPEISPYIYYVFYNRVDPQYFHQNVVRYPATEDGFVHVAKLGNLIFRKIDWSVDKNTPGRLLVDFAENIPPDATYSGVLIPRTITKMTGESQRVPAETEKIIVSRIIDRITLPDGKDLYYFIKAGPINFSDSENIQ